MRIDSKMISPTALVAVIGIFCVVCTPAMAWTTYTFDASVGNWQDADSWDPVTGPPAAGDTAIVLAGQTCNIETAFDAVVDVLEIQKSSDGTSHGEVRICAGGTLTVKADCPKIDGILWFWKQSTQGTGEPPGELIIDGDRTMTGHSSTTGNVPAYIDTQNLTAIKGIIKGVDTNSKLTVVGASAFADFEVVGQIDVQVQLVNEAKVGGGDGATPAGFKRTLTLSINPKSGGGIWFASKGKLLVADGTVVSGAGRWEMIEQLSGGDPVIQFDEPALGLTGDFDLMLGTLQVNDSIKTEGKLDFEKGFSADSVEIHVAPNKTAEFGLNATCP